MSRHHQGHGLTLEQKYPPSEPCTCSICQAYCLRPGWWSVDQAMRAMAAGLAPRMMLELSPERTFGVLAPAFKGCEAGYAIQEFSGNGCTFFNHEQCELYGSGLEPLECCFCHHSRVGEGANCHADLEKDWRTPAGQALVQAWMRAAGLGERYNE